jgi:hypothetical protein
MTNMRWHEANPVPIYPRSAFLGWHLRHEAVCNCRATPEAVLLELDALGIVTPGRINRMAVPVAVVPRDSAAPQFPHVLRFGTQAVCAANAIQDRRS